MIKSEELEILQALDNVVRRQTTMDTITVKVKEAEWELYLKPDNVSISIPIPLQLLGRDVPSIVKSCRIFVQRENSSSPVERHPNSVQRVMSFLGSCRVMVGEGKSEKGYELNSAYDFPLEGRWLPVPENVWHQAITPAERWVALAFHTMEQDKIIDEYRK